MTPSPCPVRSGRAPLEALSDDALMALVRAENRDAFSALVTRHAEWLVRACARWANDAEVGAELAQEVWVSVWAARGQYRTDGKCQAWLLTLARNRCRNHWRHQATCLKHVQLEAAAGPPAFLADHAEGLVVFERRRKLREALSELPEKMQDALLLRYAEELPYDAMTSVLRAGESTLRSRVHHGLRLLKQKLEKGR